MADIREIRDPVELTFQYLTTAPSPSALRVLVSALEEPHAEIKAHAVTALLRRHEKTGLHALVRAYHTLGPARDLIADHFEGLLGALRESIRDPWPQARQNAVDLVCFRGGPHLAHLLTQALGDTNAAVRETAAAGLLTWAREMAADWRESREVPGARADLVGPRNALMGALWEAFRLFETHRSPAVLEALTHLDRGQLANALNQIRDLDDSRLIAILDLVRTTDDAQMAAFVYVLLEHPRLWPGALRVISERTDTVFVHALLDGAEALEKEEVRKRLQQATSVAWLDPGNADLGRLSAGRLKGLVRFAAATGMEWQTLAMFLCQLLGRTPAAGRLAVVEAASALPQGVVRPVVQAALLDEDQRVQMSATQLVLRSGWPDRDRLLVGRLASSFEPVRHLVIRELSRYSFRRYLNAFDELDPTTRELAGRAVHRIDDHMLDHLADELHALDPKRRFRALQVVETLHLEKELVPHLTRLINDPDRVVRATVVKVVGMVRTLEAMQAIITALGNRDDRVQANAIEVLEEIHSEKFVGLLEPFLRHPNNRVRANAARALIRLAYPPAREVLLGMLQDESERMRLSAVWALSQVPLEGVLPRLDRLALEDPSPRVRARAQEAVSQLRVTRETAG